MGHGRPSWGLPFLKMWKRSNKKWERYRGPKMRFQIADNSYAQINGEDARGRKPKMSFQERRFSSYSSSQWLEPKGPFTSAGPETVGVRKRISLEEGSPWGRLSGETKLASLWAKLKPYCGIEISENKSLRG